MYEYGNARVRAMKSRLLGRSAIEGLVARNDVSQVVVVLGRTDYAPDVSAALTRLSGVECVEEALRLNLARTSRAVLGYYEGRARDLVGLLLGQYDLYNLVTIVRGRAAQVGEDEIAQALLPGGQLAPATLRELAATPDLRQTVDLMLTWHVSYAWSLAGAMREFNQSRDPSVLELALARHHYAQVMARLRDGDRNVELVRHLLRQEVDVLNLTAVFRFVQAGRESSQDGIDRMLLDDGAYLDRRLLGSLAASASADQVLSRLERTRYGPALRAAAGRFASTGRISTLQRALEVHVERWSVSLFHDDPLGIGTVIAFLAAKRAEALSLRLATRGIALGLDRDAILDQIWLAV